MSLSWDSGETQVLEHIKRGEEKGFHFCWCCGGIFRRNELTQHHKIPDRYRGFPEYSDVVELHAEEEDLSNGLIVLACHRCHGKLNLIDSDNELIDAPLATWLTFWTAEERRLGKNLFYLGNRPAGLPPNAKKKNKRPRRLRAGR